ncbi:MAG: membrane protein insertase YidC [Candidatus Paceibacter sp.]|nr:membrane protein insertase YidC [Candidatus Paceibacter sp.]
MISNFYNTVFYEPLLNGLVSLVNYLPFHDIGLAIIVLTVLVRFVIFPFTHKSTTTQIKMKKIEPQLKEIKSNFKNDPQAQARKTMELYRQHGINPLSGILTLFIQIPIIFALYKVFLGGVNFDQEHIYSFVSIPENINTMFLGLVDVTKNNSYVIAFLASLSQFFQMKLAMPPLKKEKLGDSFKDSLAKSMNVQMRYVMPVFIFFIGLKFSAGVALYWTTMNVFAIVHEAIVRRKAEKIYGEPSQNNNIAAGRIS